jgi:hypothetical protein
MSRGTGSPTRSIAAASSVAVNAVASSRPVALGSRRTMRISVAPINQFPVEGDAIASLIVVHK